MKEPNAQFIPALKYHSLTRLYDPLLRWTLREAVLKRDLAEQASVAPGRRVLDLGCGTGTLSIMIKRTQLTAHVEGIDADPKILNIARQKFDHAGLELNFQSVRPKSVTYVAGTFCYPCLRVGPPR